MSTLNALDYSYGRPPVERMRSEGIQVVARYLFDTGKGITRDELAALHKAGVGVVLNYEANSGDALLGADAGRNAGADARRLAGELNAPAGTPIYYSVDQEILSDAQMRSVLAYLHAADSKTHPSRVYGQKTVVDAWYRETKRPGWQTLAWSGGEVSAHAALYQWEINQTWHGASVDYDQVLKLDKLGAWMPPGKEPNVSMFSAIQVLRGTIIGGKYATAKLRKKHPRLVHKTGLAERVDQLETKVNTLLAQHKVEHKDGN